MKELIGTQEASIFKEKHLNEQAKIVITSHKSPDGDAIGSSLGLYHVLKGMGLEVSVIIHDQPPYFLNWISGIEDILVYEHQPELCEKKL